MGEQLGEENQHIVSGQSDAVFKRPTPLGVLKIEYEELTETVRHRERQYITAQSILTSGSLIAVTAIFGFFGKEISEFVFVPKATLAGALFLIIMAWLIHIVTGKINKMFWNRIEKIEQQMGMRNGHHGLYKKLKKKWWFKMRVRNLWHVIFSGLTFFYVVGLLYFFGVIELPL